jgi:hypothetical protein
MRIDLQYGSDTGMALVDVYLESDREDALSHREIWAELQLLLATQGIVVADVVEFCLYRRGLGGEWTSAGELALGTR